MSDETANRLARTPERSGHPEGSAGEQSPLQARAAFLKNRSWELVISLNRGACARGGAQHGFNRETQEATAGEWNTKRNTTLTLGETIDFLRYCHRRAPFLFFNGNTFAEIGRQIAAALFAELPPPRLREITSAIAHCIAGVLDRDMMASLVDELCAPVEFHPGDRVKTFRGTMRGVIVRRLPDGRVLWRTDTDSERIADPETLLRQKSGNA
jgi:hypothetical protein